MHWMPVSFRRKAILAVSMMILACLAMGGVLSLRFIKASDPFLRPKEYGYVWRDKAVTAVVYDLYTTQRPKQLFFLWKGQRFGQEFIWYDNGQMMARRFYKNGLPHGVWKMWHENGSVKSYKTYVNGVIDGEGWAWHSNGQVSDYNLFEMGREISHKSWVFDGTPYYNYVYQKGEKVGMKGGDFCKRTDVIKR